jgi:hypothetical protein
MDAKMREGGLDADLLERVAGLSPAGQRWLRTVLVAIDDLQTIDERSDDGRRRTATKEKRAPARPVANLEDVIEGKSTLDDQLEEYPELTEEMEGLAQVIDLLREQGAARRRTGEQILREEILGEPPEESAEEDEEGREEAE